MHVSTHSAIRRLMALALPLALVIAWASGCSDNTVQPAGNNLNRTNGVVLQGGAFDVKVDRATWRSATITIHQTLTPNGSTDPENSWAFNESFTNGKIILAYRDAVGNMVKRMENVRVDNITRKLYRDDAAVSTVGDVFPGLEIPASATDVHLCVYYDYPVSMEVAPAAEGYVVESAISFANVEPAAIEPGPKDSAKVYKTDSGRTITTTDDPYPRSPDITDSAACEQLKRWGLKDSVTQTGPPTDSTNCAGWVFTCGEKWMPDSGDIWKIFKDNGYKEVKDPKPGDVVIYKDAQGRITHVGLVRSDGKGGIKIESKWGRLGRYCHRPDQVPPGYGKPCYYHTDRPAPPGAKDPEKEKHTLK